MEKLELSESGEKGGGVSRWEWVDGEQLVLFSITIIIFYFIFCENKTK